MKPNSTKITLLFLALAWCIAPIFGQQTPDKKDKFKQLYEELPTPNVYRNGAGGPGHRYYQQQADYVMNIRLDDEKQRIYGEETIAYTNNSPDVLEYLWIQLDQNHFDDESDTYSTRPSTMSERMTLRQLDGFTPTFDGGDKIEFVKDVIGKDLKYTVVKTMMRIDLPTVLAPGGKYSFKIKWWFNIVDRLKLGGRSGCEYFPEDKNYLYSIAQFFPRMCVYDDIEGWQNKQFLGTGEFTLVFGNYDVSLTVPDDHIVVATGTLQNTKDILSKEQMARFEKAKTEYSTPVVIVTEDEARENEREKGKGEKTWRFKADNVRDFAFASSRKFIWDAMSVKQSNGTNVLAMSAYPKEANPLWGQFSTKAIAHTLKWYSHYTFDYPYPVAISVEAANGMEYPMICFNNGRVEKDGTYSERTKYGTIGVIIHEVGHNYFPMIVNSDERQWTWMDEGLNSFLQFLAEQQWERDYPSRRGFANSIVPYMKMDKKMLEPIMTNSEQVSQLGNNAYGKPAAALNILRETVMGRELFDHAFKMYANRWKFKHPAPSDFFRTMEDASGIDLDWFWNGWFYTCDNVDIALEDVKWFRPDSKNPDVEKTLARKEQEKQPRNITSIRNEKEISKTQEELDPSIRDFYYSYDPLQVTILDKEDYQKYLSGLSDEEKKILGANKNFYEIKFKNKGGLVMPLILRFDFADGTFKEYRIPAEIWRLNNEEVSKVFVTEKEATQITLDPYLETADVDMENNFFPPKSQQSRFELFKGSNLGPRQMMETGDNPMQKAKKIQSKANGSN
jgi:hypothetical protein